MLALEAGEICLELPMENVIQGRPLDLCCEAAKLGTLSLLFFVLNFSCSCALGSLSLHTDIIS